MALGHNRNLAQQKGVRVITGHSWRLRCGIIIEIFMSQMIKRTTAETNYYYMQESEPLSCLFILKVGLAASELAWNSREARVMLTCSSRKEISFGVDGVKIRYEGVMHPYNMGIAASASHLSPPLLFHWRVSNRIVTRVKVPPTILGSASAGFTLKASKHPLSVAELNSTTGYLSTHVPIYNLSFPSIE